MNWFSWFRPKNQGRGNATHGIIEIEIKLVRVVLGHEATEMYWSDVSCIEVGRKPNTTVDIFYVYLSDNSGNEIYADDLMVRFEKFRDAVFARWPEIESSWTSVFNGSPEKAERVEIWKQ